ncbi:MAG: hypothetical protein Q8N77_04740 [Nanoarchaeota archaeon]|nr:hypothetical protein [Nanoarchaeota archaeon]
MEEILSLVSKANRSFQTADHLAYVTYPLLKETKLVITITENLYSAFICAMDAFLAYERMYKRIHEIPQDFRSRLEVFSKIAPRYGIGRDQVLLIEDLKRVIDCRNKSPIEFVRQDKLVICSEDYKMRTLSYDKVKDYLVKSKPFFTALNRVFRENREK